MSLARSYGCIRSTPDARDYPIGALLQKIGDGSPLPEAESLRPYVRVIGDQGISSACVSFSGDAVVAIRGRKMGLDTPELSQLVSYALTRGEDLLPGETLVDRGSIPRLFWKTAQKRGVVSAARYPWAPELVNAPLPFDCFEAGLAARVASYHAIEETGEARCQRIRETIHAGSAVQIAMPVGKAFESIDGPELYAGRQDPILGYHAVCLIGFGGGYFELLNSWGVGWGYGGVARIAASYIGSSEITDLYAADVVPGELP